MDGIAFTTNSNERRYIIEGFLPKGTKRTIQVVSLVGDCKGTASVVITWSRRPKGPFDDANPKWDFIDIDETCSLWMKYFEKGYSYGKEV